LQTEVLYPGPDEMIGENPQHSDEEAMRFSTSIALTHFGQQKPDDDREEQCKPVQ
jgi:hypothetical protein